MELNRCEECKNWFFHHIRLTLTSAKCISFRFPQFVRIFSALRLHCVYRMTISGDISFTSGYAYKNKSRQHVSRHSQRQCRRPFVVAIVIARRWRHDSGGGDKQRNRITQGEKEANSLKDATTCVSCIMEPWLVARPRLRHTNIVAYSRDSHKTNI